MGRSKIDIKTRTKKCNRCGKWKSWSDFNRRKASRICGRQGHCRECDREWGRKYHKVRKHPPRETAQQKWCRAETKRLIRKGVIKKLSRCEVCGVSDPQAHHPDYSKPELVEWLCRLCHEHAHWKMKYGQPHPDSKREQ
jgi:hypothetical protein